MKKLFIAFMLLICAGAALAAYAYVDGKKFINTPANVALGQDAKFFYLVIKPGTTFNQVVEHLYAEGGISDKDRFKIYGRIRKAASKIKAGEFEFNSSWNPQEVMDQLISGRVLPHRITIKEGLPWWEVAALLESKGFAKSADFEAIITNPAFLRKYGIPFANAEGFLFPDTYMLNRPRTLTKEQAEHVAETLVRTFWQKSSGLWKDATAVDSLNGGAYPQRPEGISNLVPDFALAKPDEVKRIIILATLVEKETAVADERPRVAGVYSNRLRIKMPLQCDPTIIYGLGPKFNGTIYRSQINDRKNPYNTYQLPGLPPGPICSPGLGALNAAFAPENNQFLYFVATAAGDGRHTFSKTLKEHNQAVQRYRQAVRSNTR